MGNEAQPATTVYGKPGCFGCRATTRQLDKDKVPYVYLDISVNEAAHQEVKALGYQAAPVVVSNGTHWAGFRPDKLKALKDG